MRIIPPQEGPPSIPDIDVQTLRPMMMLSDALLAKTSQALKVCEGLVTPLSVQLASIVVASQREGIRDYAKIYEMAVPKNYRLCYPSQDDVVGIIDLLPARTSKLLDEMIWSERQLAQSLFDNHGLTLFQTVFHPGVLSMAVVNHEAKPIINRVTAIR